MADLQEVAALLHVHKGLHEHGDAFPNLKKAVLEKLREIEAEHAPEEPKTLVAELEPAPAPAEQTEHEHVE